MYALNPSLVTVFLLQFIAPMQNFRHVFTLQTCLEHNRDRGEQVAVGVRVSLLVWQFGAEKLWSGKRFKYMDSCPLLFSVPN